MNELLWIPQPNKDIRVALFLTLLRVNVWIKTRDLGAKISYKLILAISFTQFFLNIFGLQ